MAAHQIGLAFVGVAAGLEIGVGAVERELAVAGLVDVVDVFQVLHARYVGAVHKPLFRYAKIHHHTVGESVVDRQTSVEIFREIAIVNAYALGKVALSQIEFLYQVLYSCYSFLVFHNLCGFDGFGW